MRPRRENEPGEMEIRKASVSGEDKGGVGGRRVTGNEGSET